MTRKELAIEVLQENYTSDEETLRRILYGRDRNDDKSLLAMVSYAMANDAGEKIDVIDKGIIEDILDGMNEYIRSYQAIPLFKQKIWNLFYDWIKAIAEKYEIDNIDELVEDIMVRPIDEDPYVTIIKELHGKKSKVEMANKLCVSEKTIQTDLHLLDPSLDQDKKKNHEGRSGNKKKKDIPRFGGQLLQVKIDCEDRDIPRDDNPAKTAKKIRLYNTSETLNPVAMQLNVTQVGIILKGLQLAFDTEVSYNSLYLALNIWSQLSPYCQGRVMNNYRLEDKELHEFLEFIMETENTTMFMTEIDMFEDESIGSKIDIAFKGSRRCNVKINSRVLRNCTITHDGKGYVLHCENKECRIKEEEIEDIVLIKE